MPSENAEVHQPRSAAYRIASLLFLPTIFYFLCFAVLTFPLLKHFSTHFLTDDGDGLQNVWSMWWVHRSLVDLHQSVWFTTVIHFPYGTDVSGHTLDLTDGIIALPLMHFLTLAQAYNVVTILAFVATGLTTFWLAFHFTRHYLASLAGGFIFTFCSYRFAHAQGHLSLISFEWVPLFTLWWHIQMTTPRLRVALAAGLCLCAAYFTSLYAFLDAAMIGALMLMFALFQARKSFFNRRQILAMTAFLAVLAVTVGPAVYSMLQVNRDDPLLGGHDPLEYSMDLLSPLIYGGHWRFAHLTRFFWQKLPGNIHESSVYIGWAVLSLVIYAWIKRRGNDHKAIVFWASAFLLFGILALGPKLQIDARCFDSITLPYRLLEDIFPPMKLSGMPIRLAVMSLLSAAMLSAFAIKMLLDAGTRRRRWIVGALCVVIVIESFPAPIPATAVKPPAYIAALEKVRGPGAVLDIASQSERALYYSTLYDRPMGMGHLARLPTSVMEKDSGVEHYYLARDFAFLLGHYHFRFMIVPADYGDVPGDAIYRDPRVSVFDMYPQAGLSPVNASAR